MNKGRKQIDLKEFEARAQGNDRDRRAQSNDRDRREQSNDRDRREQGGILGILPDRTIASWSTYVGHM